jgi:ADP-ribose pyrophosphatase YjhB (NUDIX family)
MQSNLFQRAALFCRIRRQALRSAWAFGLLLLLTIVTVVVALDRVRWLIVAKESTTHMVELYAYHSPNGDSSSQILTLWNDFPEGTNLMVLDDANLQSTGNIIPIGNAHGAGLLHRGLWLAVLRQRNNDNSKQQQQQQYEIFLLKRAPSLKTCPGAWGLVGEHSNSRESWEETAHRAMREQLTLLPEKDGQKYHHHFQLVNLLPNNQSVLVRAPYPELRKHELQATALFAVVLSHKEANTIQPDDEVADAKWVPIAELDTVYMCNKEITDLAKFMATCLKQHGFH